MQQDQEKKRGYLEERHHSHHIDRQSNQRVREEDFDTLGNAPITTCWLSPTWRNIRLKGKERKGKGAAEAEAKEERSLGGRGRKKERSDEGKKGKRRWRWGEEADCWYARWKREVEVRHQARVSIIKERIGRRFCFETRRRSNFKWLQKCHPITF